MVVKGVSVDVVELILRADPATVMLPDKFGYVALHIATRKKRVEVLLVANTGYIPIKTIDFRLPEIIELCLIA